MIQNSNAPLHPFAIFPSLPLVYITSYLPPFLVRVPSPLSLPKVGWGTCLILSLLYHSSFSSLLLPRLPSPFCVPNLYYISMHCCTLSGLLSDPYNLGGEKLQKIYGNNNLVVQLTPQSPLSLALFDMPNSNRFDILSKSIFSEISL